MKRKRLTIIKFTMENNKQITKHFSNQITISNGAYNLPNNLPVTQKAKDVFLSSKNFPKIKDIADKNEVVQSIHTYINQTIMDKGVNMPPEEITYLKTRVADDIINHYSTYTLEEIRLSLYYGVREEFGEYFGLNAITIFKWLKSFKWELIPQTNLLMKPYLPNPDERPKETITQEQLDKDYTNRCISIHKLLQEKNEYDFYDFGNVLYEWLDKRGCIPFSNEEKQKFKKESHIKLRKKMMDNNYDLSRRGRSIQKINLDEFFQGVEEGTNREGSSAIIIGAKRIALFNFFVLTKELSIADFTNTINNRNNEL